MLLPVQAKNRFTLRSLPLLSTAIFIGGLLGSVYVYALVDQSSKAHILDRVETIAALISASDIDALTASDADLQNPSYIRLKKGLVSVQSINTDVRFAYLIAQNETGSQFFLADSESPDSSEYSPPGQAYDEASPEMHALFADGKSRVESVSGDRWGLWISGYAPIFGERGSVIALFGMDLPAYEYITEVTLYTILPFLAACALIALIALRERGRRKEQQEVDQKEEFLSIASHEIRTPLTGIRWTLETLLSKGSGTFNPQTLELLQLAHNTSVSVITRIGNLLNVSSLEKGGRALAKESVDVEPFFTEIRSMLALSAKSRGVQIVFDESVTGARAFSGDRALLQQVFNNILSNAVKYTNSNTEIRIAYRKTDTMHVFSITDQGNGIPPEVQKHMFDGYYRGNEAARSKQPGTGLGLFMAKKIIALHRGTISVRSDKGVGTTFTVAIPQ
jgi:signal transduction histidine kinase